jgi:UDP-GlcNAc:undecaprenyl-phosphate GlcNAc-1-phosphate transferase
MNLPTLSSVWVVAICLASSLALTQGMIYLGHRRGWVDKPKADRWSQTPTALYGGVAIVGAFVIGSILLLLRSDHAMRYDLYGLFAGGVILFAAGVRDDARPLNPLVKLVCQMLAIMPFLVGAGLAFTSTTFVLSIPLVMFWMLALTNSFNLLDNMDGLSAGTAAIAGGAIAGYAFLNHAPLTGALSALIAASCLGFLVFNFRARGPARIFMGDCGSMFLGYMLSGLAVIAFCPTAPLPLMHRCAQCALPLLIMELPIFDTTLVIIIRKRENRAISQGGKDHSSHRLVYTGRTDKQAVLLLYILSLAGGGTALLLSRANLPLLDFAVIALAAGLLAMFGVYLNRFPVPRLAVIKSLPLRAEAENGHRKLIETGSNSE